MCFDRNINGNRDVKFMECDYLLVQQCVKPQDCHNPFKILFKILRTLWNIIAHRLGTISSILRPTIGLSMFWINKFHFNQTLNNLDFIPNNKLKNIPTSSKLYPWVKDHPEKDWVLSDFLIEITHLNWDKIENLHYKTLSE